MIDSRKPEDALTDAWLEGGPGAVAIARNVDRLLDAVRRHLDMDVAFVSEFHGSHRVFRHVVTRLDRAPIRPGDSRPLDEGYCMRVVEGSIPQLIPDTAAVPALECIPETQRVPIGSHLSVPIQLRDGRVYGTFCCFSLASNLSLGERDAESASLACPVFTAGARFLGALGVVGPIGRFGAASGSVAQAARRWKTRLNCRTAKFPASRARPSRATRACGAAARCTASAW